MRYGRNAILLALTIVPLLLLTPAAARAEAGKTLDLGVLLRERDPENVIGKEDEDEQEKIRERLAQMVIEDSQKALKRNQTGLYPNPMLQAYVNDLGQRLIPQEALDNLPISFKIVEDPLPYADSLTTARST